ncbi:MAG TPA: CHASE3 domain-containing protein [Terrimicrobiaceae bacterium]|nr:CHASE3 domain-containing protein [Terrimicrobiaceae bacterium]
MRWTISRQILVGYAISLLLITAFGVVALIVSRDMLTSFEERRQVTLVIREADRLLSLLQDAETGQRGFVITGTELYLAPYTRAVGDLSVSMDTLQDRIKDTGHEVAQFPELRSKINEKVQELGEVIALRRSGGLESAVAAVASDRGKAVMDRIREILNQIKQEQLGFYEACNVRARADVRVFNAVMFIGIPVSALGMLFVGLLTARSITRPLNGMAAAAQRIAEGDLNVSIPNESKAAEVRALASTFTSMIQGLRQSAAVSERLAAGDLTVEVRPQSDADVAGRAQSGMVAKLSELIEQVQRSGVQVNSSSVQIAASSKQQQSTASEMAATTTEIGTTAKEMSATSSELLKAADNVNVISQQLSGLAVGGKEGLNRMEQIMRQIMEASSSITGRLGEMNDKAGNIGSVVTTITKIADQTNLLSLNAAIEAEKAGEYGRGFSVVASEIRRLADQTAASTLDIEQMVREMLSSVSAGVMGMDKFSEEVRRSAREVTEVSQQIDQMIERVQSLAPSIESVYEGMQAQTQGASQISEALAQLGDAARQTADAIRDSNRAVDQLNEASRGLQTSISRFKLR